MTPLEIAEKYVHGNHDALTDNQEIKDMVKDIEECFLNLKLESIIKERKKKLNKGYL